MHDHQQDSYARGILGSVGSVRRNLEAAGSAGIIDSEVMVSI